MAKECLWYNGESGCYEVLNFDPDGLTKEQIINKVLKEFDNKGIFGKDVDKAMKTVYLVDINHLKKLKDLKGEA